MRETQRAQVTCQQACYGACGLKSAVQGCGRRLGQSEFRHTAEAGLFSRKRKEKRDLCWQGSERTTEILEFPRPGLKIRLPKHWSEVLPIEVPEGPGSHFAHSEATS